MIAEEEPLFGRAHNQPPGLLPLDQAVLALKELFAETEQEGGKTFAQRKSEFLMSARNAVVRDRDTAGAAADLVKLAGRIWDRIHAARIERSTPYRDTADALGRAATDFWADVDDAMDGVRAKIDAFTEEEDKRIADQQREQEEQMAAMRAAAAPPPVPVVQDQPAGVTEPEAGRPHLDYTTGAGYSTRAPTPAPLAPAKRKKIRGDYGATVSAAERHVYTVTDVRAVPDYILNAPGVHEAIIAAVKGTVKVMGVPAGIARTTTTENQIR